jgi:trk system potassium uptake protein TrkA
LAVTGNAGQPSVLRQAGIREAEMVVAVTDIDEVNLVICMVASHYGVRHKIARIRNAEYFQTDAALDPSKVGIDSIISPEGLISDTLLKLLEIPGATDVATFAEGKVLLISFDICAEAPVAGVKLKDLRQMADMDSFLVTAIIRGEQTLIPMGDDEIHDGDHIVVMVHADTLPLVLPLIQRRIQPVQRVVISGAGLIGRRLAAELEHRIDRVVLIERDSSRAQEAARELQKTLVLQGDCTEPELLREGDVRHCQFFMALARDDQYNLLSALMARRQGATRVAVLTQDPRYLPVISSIGIDVVLNPRLFTVGEIMRYIRKGPVHTVTRLRGSDAEIMELEPLAGARVEGTPLMRLDWPAGAIIGAVVHDGGMTIPRGQSVIEAGDHVVVFALPEAIPKIEKLFSKKRLF